MNISKPKVLIITDIVFCIDCTNGGAIARCMEPPIISLLESLNVDWRARVMGYGDLDIGEEMQNNNVFVGDVDSIREQLSLLEGYCGGDEPESTLDAICYAAKQSDWRNRCKRVIIVLTDAFTKRIHPSTAKALGIYNIDELRTALANNQVILYLFGPQDPVYKLLGFIPRSDIILLENAREDLYSGMIDLTKYLDELLFHFSSNLDVSYIL